MTMTNDELLAWLDSAASEMDVLGDAAAAIRALEAKVLWMEGDMRVLRRRDDKLVAEIYELRAALDQERADNERLRAFAQWALDRIPDAVCDEMHRHGLIDINGVPTALLSGRGEPPLPAPPSEGEVKP